MIHDVVDPAGGNGGGAQALVERVREGVVKLAVIVGDAVAREIQDEEIVTLLVAKEGLDLFANLRRKLVSKDIHLEVADGGITEDNSKGFGVLGRCDKGAEKWVLVLPVRNDERASRHSATPFGG